MRTKVGRLERLIKSVCMTWALMMGRGPFLPSRSRALQVRCVKISWIRHEMTTLITERKYPKALHDLARYINEPDFPFAFLQFLYSRRHPNRPIPDDLAVRLDFTGKIRVFHSAIACFYAPSDLCGPAGMYRQRIRSNPSWYGCPRRDTVFVVQDEDRPGMDGLLVARVHLFFSSYRRPLCLSLPKGS